MKNITDKKYIGVIVERQFLSDEKILYTLDYAASGLPMKDRDGNRFFRTESGDDFFYTSDYENCFSDNNYYCAWYEEEEKLKSTLEEDWDIKIEKTEDLIDIISDVMFDNVYVARIDYEEGKMYLKHETLARTAKETKTLKEKIQDKYKSATTKSLLPATINNKIENNLKSLIEIPFQDIDSCDYYKLLEIRNNMEKEFHSRNILNACIKYLQGNKEILPLFIEEFEKNDKVKELIKGLENNSITKEELDSYFNINSNILDNINDYIKEIDLKTLYGENTEEQREKEQEKLDYIFTTLLNVKNSNKIYDEMRQTVISQDAAIKRLITEINRFSLLDDPSNKKGILLTGSTGVGKTLIIKTLSELLNKPVCIIDSSQLVINGYKGTHIDEYLESCLAELNYDVNKLENAIIYFDEIDKKGMSNDSDVSGKGVLDSLLKFLDGTVYNLEVNEGVGRTNYQIRTDNMLVIAGGSFNSVYGRTPKRDMGFHASKNPPKLEITEDDFMTYGRMTKEFMGRFPIVIHLNDLEEKDYKRILLESKKSPLKIEKETFEKIGVNLETTKQFLSEVSKKASENGKGARGLGGIISTCTSEAFAYATENFGEVDSIKLTKQTVEDNKKFDIVKHNTRGKEYTKTLH